MPSCDRARSWSWASLVVGLAAFPIGCALGYDFSGYEAAAPLPPSHDSGIVDSTAPSDATSVPPPATISSFPTYRAWSDGTYASSCDAYLHPTSTAYVYEGAKGSGVYAVKPIRAESPFRVLCEMTETEGWTLVTSSSYDERARGAATTQTLDCVTATSYCNVASEPWDYEYIRETWSACPGAEARITKAAFQDDTNACNNQVDSLLFTFRSPIFVGLKSWDDCSFGCLAQSWFAAQRLTPGYPTLLTDAKFVTAIAGGLTTLAPANGCTATGYTCATGYDGIWIR